ncbi:MAG: phospholipid carrier-dependent glycosyltransferase [Candidatus Xenobia bacterium]
MTSRDGLLLLALVLCGLLIRCWNLSAPYKQYFDEIYYVPAAENYLEGKKDTNTVHPPGGKLQMAVFMEAWWGVERYVLHTWHPHGFSTISWRVGSLVLGLALIPMTWWLALSMFGSRPVAFLAAFFVTIDWLEIVQSRIAMLDMYQAFWIMAGLMFTWQYIKAEGTPFKPLVLACICYGIGTATKWSCLFAAFGGILAILLLKAYPSWTRRLLDATRILYLGLFFVVLIYAAAFLPLYFDIHREKPGPVLATARETVKEVHDNMMLMWRFRHNKKEFTHRYLSDWWRWPTDLRPIWYIYEEREDPGISFFARLQNTSLFQATIGREMRKDDMDRWVYGAIAMGSWWVWWFFLLFLFFVFIRAGVSVWFLSHPPPAGEEPPPPDSAYVEWHESWTRGEEKGLIFCLLAYLPQVLLWAVNTGFMFYMLPVVPFMSIIVGHTIYDWRDLPMGKLVMGLFIGVALILLFLYWPLLVAYPIPKPWMYKLIFLHKNWI